MMKLKEFEAKQLLMYSQISVSKGLVISNINDIPKFNNKRLIKVQTLVGGRGKAGGIKTVNNRKGAQQVATLFLGQQFLNEQVTEILLDEKVTIAKEYYLGVLFDTSKRSPILIFSEEGGVDIEELKAKFPEKIFIREIDYLDGLTENVLTVLPEDIKEIAKKLYDCFVHFDCKMIEINPLVRTAENQLVAVDAVAVLDDDANFRREIKFTERTDNRIATAREIAAQQIDKDDHRGVAGKTFLDLDGDIAILTSGGGASMTLMDALIEYGGKPANFTEYSGNPSREKVKKLTQIVLNKENLSGLLVAGVIANFTNIKETLQGVVDVLKEKNPDFPIVIRRAGLQDDDAKIMLQQAKEQYNLDIHYFDEKTSLTKAVEIMVNLSNKYKMANRKDCK